MTGREQKLLKQTASLGLLLTVVVVVVNQLGVLSPLENWLYDRRARYCQFFTPPPTDRLVHLHINDTSQEAMGRWPWDRDRMAAIVDEIRLAGAVAVAFDIIFSEPQDQRSQTITGNKTVASHDEVLAESIRQLGNVLVPIAISESSETSPLYEQMFEAFMVDLELSPERMAQVVDEVELSQGRLDEGDANRFVRARAEAMYERIDRELNRNKQLGLDELRRKLLPGIDPNVVSVQTRVLARQYDRVRSNGALRRLVRPTFASEADVLPLGESLLPIARFSEAAGATGFVYYDPDPDGAVRSIPLWVEHRGAIFPQLGLALACRYLGVDVSQAIISKHHIVLPRPVEQGGNIVIPVRRRRFEKLDRSYDLVMDLPYFGATEQWATMYDPQRRTSVQHMPISIVWQITETRRQIIGNNVAVDDAIRFLYDNTDPAKLEAYQQNPLPLDDPTARQEAIESVLADDFIEANVEACAAEINEDSDTVDEKVRRFVASWRCLTESRLRTPQLALDLTEQRKQVSSQLNGRAVLIGWTATGAAADFVPTPLHAKCPGVIVHGVAFNAIVTNHMWRRAPTWTTITITALIGVLTVLCVATLTPGGGAMAATALLATYAVLNAVVLFDHGNTIVDLAGPLAAVVLVWGGCTMFRFVVERAERKRITSRFQSYVDPVLVNYVIEHPEKARLDGEVRELTVTFTDLTGFTTISETLQERTVGILNEYTSLMVPIIRQQNGYVNKFLGDGMMFFYGAPQQNEYHAIDAVLTALKMQKAMVPFNQRLAEQGLPNVTMRIGISSGSMVVGDAGSADASDYTVLGDTVNLGARLESANKYTGTWIMINQRAAELVGDQFLLRPIGRLQVVGKTEGVMVYEPLCATDDATDRQKQLVVASGAVVDTYVAADFPACLKAVDALESEFGQSKLTALYRDLATKYADSHPGDGFGGEIVLEAK